MRSGTGRATPALSFHVGGLRLRAVLIEPSSTMPAASATRSARKRLNASRNRPRVGLCSRPSVSPPRNAQPNTSCLRSQAASASCVGRSYMPGVYLLRGVSRPSHSRRACADFSARGAIDAATRLRVLAQRAERGLGRGAGGGAVTELLLQPFGVAPRLVEVAPRAIAVEVPDLAGVLLEALPVDGVVASLARRRDIRLHPRRQHG